MSTEIPNNIEKEPKDLNSTLYTRYVDILLSETFQPEFDWRTYPELAYIKIDDENEISTLKALDIRNNGEEGGLILDIVYIPSVIPYNKMLKVKLGECKLYRILINDTIRINTLRNLYENLWGEIDRDTSCDDIDEATQEEIKHLMEGTLKLLPSEEKESLNIS